MDILVFVRGSARPLGPRGAKVGGGIWASWVGGAGKVGGERCPPSVARRGARGSGLRSLGPREGGGGGSGAHWRGGDRIWPPRLTCGVESLSGCEAGCRVMGGCASRTGVEVSRLRGGSRVESADKL